MAILSLFLFPIFKRENYCPHSCFLSPGMDRGTGWRATPGQETASSRNSLGRKKLFFNYCLVILLPVPSAPLAFWGMFWWKECNFQDVLCLAYFYVHRDLSFVGLPLSENILSLPIPTPLCQLSFWIFLECLVAARGRDEETQLVAAWGQWIREAMRLVMEPGAYPKGSGVRPFQWALPWVSEPWTKRRRIVFFLFWSHLCFSKWPGGTRS